MSYVYTLTRKKAWLLVLIAFIISTGIRLPGLVRPLSRHHESITALELVSIESWQQSGGVSSAHYLPMFNYHNPGDKRIPDNLKIDSKGNYVYISYGSGWNLLPYFLFKLMHIKATAFSLRIINILLSGVSCFFLFCLMTGTVPKRNDYTVAALTCIIFILNPGMLWYTGNVYVNCGVAIPFILAFLYTITRIITMPGTINTVKCIILFLLVICLIAIDWISLFLAFTSVVILLFKIRSNKLLIYPAVVITLAAGAGMSVILYQFVSFLGWQMVSNNLGFKFGQRGIPPFNALFTDAVKTMMHFITASAPLIALLIAGVIQKRIQKKVISIDNNIKWALAVLLPALLLYNITFLSWTAVHEFSILYYSIGFAILGGILLQQVFPIKRLSLVLAGFIAVGITQYFIINPPGKKSFDNEPYSFYQKIGETIAQRSTPFQAIFINLELTPPVSYYAKRYIDYAASPESAKKLLTRCITTEGVWFEVKNFQIVSITYLHR